MPIMVVKVPFKIATAGKTLLLVKPSVLLACMELTIYGGPLVWRNMEVMVNEEDVSLSFLMDRNLM